MKTELEINPERLDSVSDGSSPRIDREREIDRIFGNYVERIYRFLYRRVGNREDAEDLTSQVFLKALNLLDTGRTDAEVSSWLFAVARTLLADNWRRYYRGTAPVVLDDVLLARVPQQEIHIEESSNQSELRANHILAALPPRYRQVLELRFLRGMSVHETATAMGITAGSVRVLQHRALARAAQS
ncbi:MAG: RNA polymerase sigma factor [Chloroflexota bacterium]